MNYNGNYNNANMLPQNRQIYNQMLGSQMQLNPTAFNQQSLQNMPNMPNMNNNINMMNQIPMNMSMPNTQSPYSNANAFNMGNNMNKLSPNQIQNMSLNHYSHPFMN